MNVPNRGRTRVLFDATILADGLLKTSRRGGIFWTTRALFRGLAARTEIELGVYASPFAVDQVNEFLAREFPDAGYRVITRKRSSILGRLRRIVEQYRCRPHVKAVRFPLRLLETALKIATILQDRYSGGRGVDRLADGYDVFFSPCYLAPRAIRLHSKVRRVTVLYDTIPKIFPEHSLFTRLGFSWNFELIRGLRADDRCLAISECTKRDFLRFSKDLKDRNISLLPLAADRKFHVENSHEAIAAMRRKYCIPEGTRYFLSLCTIAPHKNLDFALRAFARFIEKTGDDKTVFVLAGGRWDRFEGAWAAALAEVENVRGRIIHTGYVDDEDLAALYSGATLFIYPSLYEGFGLPPLEAMQCGTPVVTSNVSSLPEVVGDAAITVDPYDVNAAAGAIERIAGDAVLRERMIERGLARAGQFSWEKTVEIAVMNLI